MYSPFSKKLNDLDGNDLEILIDIPEGWYIEYKKEPCTPKDYAKEVSAFANAYGGWLFIGLEEDPNTGKPLGGPGLDQNSARKLADSARDAITQNTSSAPFVEIKIVQGPINSLSISAQQCILVIKVPQSENTPHIHCSGRIYVRQVDKASSHKAEPEEIKSRGELDSLYKRSQKLHDKTLSILKMGFDEKWISEFHQPWFHLAFTPDPSFHEKPELLLFDDFKSIILNKEDNPNFIELPDIYCSALGYVASNNSQQQFPDSSAATLEYDFCLGSIFITIPLSCGIVSLENQFFLNDNDIGEEMFYFLRQKGFGESQIFDLSYLFSAMAGFYEKIYDILSSVQIGKNYIYQLQMTNLFRRIPYFKSSSYLEWCKKNTIPILRRNQFSVPLMKNSWCKIGDLQNRETIVDILYETVNCLGVPISLTDQIVEETFKIKGS